jgi:hypothetical protein
MKFSKRFGARAIVIPPLLAGTIALSQAPRSVDGRSERDCAADQDSDRPSGDFTTRSND